MSSSADAIPPPLPDPPLGAPLGEDHVELDELPNAVRAWIAAAHLVPLFAYALYWIPGSAAILAAPLAIRRYRGALHPLVADQALEAFQFHVIAAAVTFAFAFTIVGWILAWAVVVASAVLAILAASRAIAGERYRYPWIPRLLG